MNKPVFLAACLLLTPYMASAANEPAVTEKPMLRDVNVSNTGIHKGDRDDKTGTQRDADNSGINKRDRNDMTLTPMDQLNNQADLNITQDIRQALMKGEFSMDAKNIKVITRNGAVTLRGPVKSAAELERISVQVKALPGIKSVDNQLQVK